MTTVTFKITLEEDHTWTRVWVVDSTECTNMAAVEAVLASGEPVQSYANSICGPELTFFMDANDVRVGKAGCLVRADMESRQEAWRWYSKMLSVEVTSID